MFIIASKNNTPGPIFFGHADETFVIGSKSLRVMLLEKEYFDMWMHRLMDTLERIEKNQKPPKAPEYPVLENGEKLYDNFDLCRMLHVSKRTLQRYRTEYGLPYRRLNQKTFYRESDVLRFLRENLKRFQDLDDMT